MKTTFYVLTLLLLWFGNLGNLAAKNYRILKLWNCKNIRIGNKIMKKGSVFSDHQMIYWTDARQLIMVEPINGGSALKISKHGFDKYEAKTLIELLTKEKNMGHRSLLGKHYTDRDYYLADSLHFKVIDKTNKGFIAEAVWENEGNQIVTPIERTPDGQYYIITPRIFGQYTPRDIHLDIRERDISIDLINYVYRQVSIIYIP